MRTGIEGGAVKVSGAKGFAPPRDYKVSRNETGAGGRGYIAGPYAVLLHAQVCATYMDGFRATAVCPLGGSRAAEKARRTAESIIKRSVCQCRNICEA